MNTKDLMIMRQSQMKIALEYYQNLGVKPTCLELIALAEHLAHFCNSGLTKEIVEKTKSVDKFLNELRNDVKETV